MVATVKTPRMLMPSPSSVAVVLWGIQFAFIIFSSNPQTQAAVLQSGNRTASQGLPPLQAALPTPDTLAGRTSRLKVLHAEARIFVYEDFLSADECDKIIALGTTRLHVKPIPPDRANFKLKEFPIIQDIEERISDLTLVSARHGSGLVLKRYLPSKQLSIPYHWDFRYKGTYNGGQNYATVLMYLSDVEEGGETFFPYIPAPGGGGDMSFSECARDFLAVKPKKGRAVVFHATRPSGAFEPRSMHGICPVIKGVKWSMQQFRHIGAFAEGRSAKPQSIAPTINPEPIEPAADCPDTGAECGRRADKKDCHAQRAWMLGNATHPGNCLSTCMRCDIWRQHLELVQQQQGAQ